jgi:hypothetical protein
MSDAVTAEALAVLKELEAEPPTIREELERKVVAEIERVYLAVRAGKISANAYHAALAGLWGGVAGLVSHESMELITAAQKEFPGGLTQTMRFAAIVGEVVAVVSWDVGSATVKTALKKPGLAAIENVSTTPDGEPALKVYLLKVKSLREAPGAQVI